LNKRIQQMIRGKNIIGLGSRRIVYDLSNKKRLADMKDTFRRHGIVPYEIFGRYGPNCQNLRMSPRECSCLQQSD
jgi:hypothetical protein